MISRWHIAAILVLVVIILVPITVLAVVTCPYGIVNDPFPGKCPRYTDTDQNGICDISETDTGPVPATMVPTTVPVSPASSQSASGFGLVIQTGYDGGEDDDDDEDECEEDDEGSRNRERNRNSPSSVSDSGSGSAAVPAATPAPITPSPTSVNPAVRSTTSQAAVPCPYGIASDPYPGKCPRYVDTNGDGFCDLSVLEEAVLTSAPTTPVTVSEASPNQTCSSTAVPSSVSCPFGITNDPYPGKCPAYLDANKDALCDLSQEPACGNVDLTGTACPFGKVHDPYPGACAKYVDMNINGICDYSEDTGGETGSEDIGGSGSVPPTGLLAAGMGAGCIVIGYSFGRGKK